MRVGPPDSPSYVIMVSTRVVDLMAHEDFLPGHGIAYTGQDGGKLFDQVWPIPGLF